MLIRGESGHRRTWRFFRVTACAAVTLGCGLSLTNSVPAHASNEQVSVTTPTEDRIVYGQPILMTIKAQADSLFSGTIVISSIGAPPQTHPVELPGGTAKQLTIVAPPLGDNTDRYQIELFDRTETSVAKTKLASSLEAGDSVVGVFPSLTANMPDVKQSPLGVAAYLFPFDPSQFEFALAGLTAYDVLVATPNELGKLDDDAQASLATWITDGGRLVIDGIADDVATFDLPVAWNPSGQSGVPRRVLDLGEVVFAGGSIANGDWMLATSPVSARSPAAAGTYSFGMNFGGWGGDSVTDSLARYTNSSVLPTAALAIAIGLYALVVGPGLFFVFRRRRSRIWLAAPLVAIIATAGVLFTGHVQRSKIVDAYGAVISINEAGSTSTAWRLKFARRDGNQSVELPAGFLPFQTTWESGPLEVDDRPTGNVVTQKVTSGSFGLFAGSASSAPFDGGLVATASSEGKKLVGTVTNHLAIPLKDVAVFWGGNATNVGDLQPDESAEFELKPINPNEPTDPPTWSAWPTAITESMRRSMGNVFPPGQAPDPPAYDPQTPVALGLWDDFVVQQSMNLAATDAFAVGGWTQELPNPLRPDDDPPAAGTTLVAMTGLVHPSSISEPANVGVISAKEGPAPGGNWSIIAVLRMTPPTLSPTAGVNEPGGDVVLTRPTGVTKTEVFMDGDWVQLDGQHKPVRLPPQAFDPTGVVYVRTRITQQNYTLLPTLEVSNPDHASVDFADATEQGS